MSKTTVLLLSSICLLSCGKGLSTTSSVSTPLYQPSIPSLSADTSGGLFAKTESSSPVENVSYQAEASQPLNPAGQPLIQEKNDRKVIHEAEITIKVKEPMVVRDQVIEIAKQQSGFVLSSDQGIEDAFLTLRVPDENLETTLFQIGELGKVTQRAVRGQDVTDQYQDLSIRLSSAQQLLHRYQEILSAAENVDSMLAIEKEIGRVMHEIEQIKGILIYLDDKTTLATIQVRIQKKHTLGPVGAVFYGIGWAVSKLFVLK